MLCILWVVYFFALSPRKSVSGSLIKCRVYCSVCSMYFGMSLLSHMKCAVKKRVASHMMMRRLLLSWKEVGLIVPQESELTKAPGSKWFVVRLWGAGCSLT